MHFVAHVVNEGTVPVEIRNIKYEMRSATGAIVEVGDIPQAYPNKIAPGASAVIGRTVRADAAVANADVASVDIRFETIRTSSIDNLLDVSNISFRGSSPGGQPVITGDVQNNGRNVYDNIQTAVVLIDSTSRWIGYVTASLPVRSLKPGDKAQFVTNADLPPSVNTRTVSFRGFSFDK
ncbi:MAG: hypothetical protein C4558_04495 [Dehalococcoidia bacterium]|nr:MAG: hypothetical protein C4558_04495 [Dehalococcoidia bacterium]